MIVFRDPALNEGAGPAPAPTHSAARAGPDRAAVRDPARPSDHRLAAASRRTHRVVSLRRRIHEAQGDRVRSIGIDLTRSAVNSRRRRRTSTRGAPVESDFFPTFRLAAPRRASRFGQRPVPSPENWPALTAGLARMQRVARIGRANASFQLWDCRFHPRLSEFVGRAAIRYDLHGGSFGDFRFCDAPKCRSVIHSASPDNSCVCAIP